MFHRVQLIDDLAVENYHFTKFADAVSKAYQWLCKAKEDTENLQIEIKTFFDDGSTAYRGIWSYLPNMEGCDDTDELNALRNTTDLAIYD